MVSPFLQIFCALFSGIIQSLAIANELLPLGSPLLALLCLIPMYKACYAAKTYAQSFWLFFIQILTVHLLSSYWLANFHGYAVFTLGASAAGTAVQGGLCGILSHAYPHRIAQNESERQLKECAGAAPTAPCKRAVWFCASWVLHEFVKSTKAMGYPWGTISMAAYKWKILTQIADITGVWGISFLFAFASCALAEGIHILCIRGGSQCSASFAGYKILLKQTATLFVLCALYGALQYAIPRHVVKEFNAVIVQQNVDPWEAGDQESIDISKRLTRAALGDLSKNGKSADLIVWSEGVLSKSFPSGQSYYSKFPKDESLTSFIKSCDTPLLAGGSVAIERSPTRRRNLNAALLFDTDGILAGFYGKMQLVPFAEKIPYSENPLMETIMREVVGFRSSLSSGVQHVVFTIPINANKHLDTPLDWQRERTATVILDENGKGDVVEREKFLHNDKANPLSSVTFSAPICFEDAFPAVCSKLFAQGSEVFVNITNDSWSKTRSAEIQHFVAASYLATEFRTTLVRCANSGYSVVVNPAGKLIVDLPLFTESSCGTSIPVYERRATFYFVFGDWLAWLCVLCVLAFCVCECVSLYLPPSPATRGKRKIKDTSTSCVSNVHSLLCTIR